MILLEMIVVIQRSFGIG